MQDYRSTPAAGPMLLARNIFNTEDKRCINAMHN